jgi:hypothetical protein
VFPTKASVSDLSPLAPAWRAFSAPHGWCLSLRLEQAAPGIKYISILYEIIIEADISTIANFCWLVKEGMCPVAGHLSPVFDL